MKSSLLLPFVTLASAICHHRTSLYRRSHGGIAARGEDGLVEVAKFGYDDLTGPLNWHGHNNQSSKCATGAWQSPINLNDTSATLVAGTSLTFDVPNLPHGAAFENLGSTLEVVAENGTLTRRGRKFHLRQFHFHTPSEHRVDSEYFPMEVHFVFEADEQQLKSEPPLPFPSLLYEFLVLVKTMSQETQLVQTCFYGFLFTVQIWRLVDHSTGPSNSVVGFLIEVDNSAPSPFLANVFAHLDEVEEPGSHAETEELDFGELQRLLGGSDVYQYDGSLTTPPCTEGIAWNVVAEPLRVDDVTYRAAKKVMKFNSRYTQNVPGQRNLLENSRVMLNAMSP
ncbi:carbonic anhydrase [Colletotrichum nymphaeae SA-01]|uniref:Carbonic anhydrase n=1 Tax=Colletotrichum nymphaeae SA-01 TaxID=1460502 RepID=A0A135URG7_9PEZI|nr:carbonic anhydrase [Colletotrichum nymphaeae SA-01]